MNKLYSSSDFEVRITEELRNSQQQLVCRKGGEEFKNVHFFFGCGLPEELMKKELGQNRELVVYKFMVLWPRKC